MPVYDCDGKVLHPEADTSTATPTTISLLGTASLARRWNEININKVRNARMKMTVTQAGPDGSFYIAFLQFPDFFDAKKIIINAGRSLITWEPTPIVKPQRELATGERPQKDNPWAWPTCVKTDTTIEHGADITALLKRPTSANNKNIYKKMTAPPKKGDVLQSQMVYYKIGIEVNTTKALLKSLDQLRFQETKGDADAEVKRAVICGKDQTVHRMVDLLDGLTDADIATFTDGLTPSQSFFILQYCRKILNGVGFLQGPAGSGKTTIIKVLVRIADKRGLKVAIVAESNSAADNVVQVVSDPAYVTVRLHPLGLERRHLMKHSRKDVSKDSLKPADPEPEAGDEPDDNGYMGKYADFNLTGKDTQDTTDQEANGTAADPSVTNRVDTAHEEAANAEGWKDDKLAIVFNDLLLKTAQDNYENAKATMNPEDPRMNVRESALWTWMLKVLGTIDKPDNAPQVNRILEQLGKKGSWKELRGLLLKAKKQELNNSEWSSYGDLIEDCGNTFVKDVARATVCTIAQQ